MHLRARVEKAPAKPLRCRHPAITRGAPGESRDGDAGASAVRLRDKDVAGPKMKRVDDEMAPVM